MLDLEEELRRVVETLDAAAIPYALCGGLALAVHGHPREGLIALKRLRSSAQDLADIAALQEPS